MVFLSRRRCDGCGRMKTFGDVVVAGEICDECSRASMGLQDMWVHSNKAIYEENLKLKEERDALKAKVEKAERTIRDVGSSLGIGNCNLENCSDSSLADRITKLKKAHESNMYEGMSIQKLFDSWDAYTNFRDLVCDYFGWKRETPMNVFTQSVMDELQKGPVIVKLHRVRNSVGTYVFRDPIRAREVHKKFNGLEVGEETYVEVDGKAYFVTGVKPLRIDFGPDDAEARKREILSKLTEEEKELIGVKE